MKNFILHSKKQILLLILSVLTFVLPVQIQAQTDDPVVAWAERLGGTFFGASGGKITSDAFGNVYMTGQFTGIVDFGGITLTSSSVSSGNPDVFVVKVNSSGTVLWAKRFGGTSPDYGVNLTVDASGNVYTTGFFNGIATFGTISLTDSFGDYRSIFVVKQNALGEVMWAEQFNCEWTNGPHSFTPTGITTDTSGNLYTIGLFSGNTATFGNITLTRLSIATSNSVDTFVVKQDASGQVLWAKNFGATDSGTAGVSALAITADILDNIYITGSFRGTADFEGTTFTGSTTGNVFLTKMNSSGQVLWAKKFGEMGTSFTSSGHSITVDMTGNVYVTGRFLGEMIVGTDTITSAYNSQYNMYTYNVFILKTASSGEGLWVKGFESPSSGQGSSIIVDSFNNLYVTGNFYNTIDFGGITLTSSPTASTNNVFVLKTDSSGTVEWAEHFFGSGNNSGRGITLGLGENIYVSGHFSDTITFGNTSLTTIGNTNNIFLVKIAMDGNLVLEQNQPEQYKVYPNPVKDIINIEIPESDTDITVEVFNLLGQKVMNFGTITYSKTLDLSNLSTGIYLLKINNSTIKIKKQ